MQNISAFFQRGHLKVEEPRVFEGNFNKSFKPFFLSKDDNDMVGREAIMVISIWVVPLKQKSVNVDGSMRITVEFGKK